MAVFNGHQHWANPHHKKEIDYYVLCSITKNKKSDGKPDGVYFIIEIKNSALKVVEKQLKF